MKRRIALMAAATLVCGLALGSLGAQSLGQEMAGQSQQNAKPLDAQASNPNVMGWMQGFPPPRDKILSAQDSSFPGSVPAGVRANLAAHGSGVRRLLCD